MKHNDLPDTLHELIETAIADVRRLNRNVYRPHYGDWHSPLGHGLCAICLAGGVLAGSLECSPTEDGYPSQLPADLKRKLIALEEARSGNWHEAFRQVHLFHPSGLTSARLLNTPAPLKSTFFGWEEFDTHLESLEELVPLILEIELEYLHG